MKSMTSIALALATALVVPSALAETETAQQPKSKCVPPAGADCPSAAKKKAAGTAAKAKDQDKDKDAAAEAAMQPEPPATEPESEAPPPPPPEGIGGGPTTEPEPVAPPPPAPVVTQTTTVVDTTAVETAREDSGRHVRRGFGIGVFGSAGAADEARWGFGGRLEYVLPFGLAFGGSYSVHYETEGQRTLVRPLLGEIGWAFAVVKHLEVRPMVGIGWAFASTRRDTFENSNGQTVRLAVTDGVDVAPGAKVSYVARAIEVYTMPKYHFISGNNFAAIELGAGARF